ncbi:hypothetical protein ACFQ93_19950 [Streptomyces sp. NPDC056601]|uniref:hypothetical protein n=1 Tax=Streptomyces sp. NPDC056601 TaxID=3345875 RepID=UPI0036A4A107
MFVFLALPALLAIPVWIVAVVVKFVSVALPGRRADWSRDLLRWCAAMAAAAAVGLYVLGLGAVQLSAHESESGASSSPAPSCRDADVDDSTLQHLVGHRASYVPLRFDCVLDDGTTYPSSHGYAWLNGLTAAFGATAGVLVGTSLVTRRVALRAAAPAAPPAVGSGFRGDLDQICQRPPP